MYYIGIDIGGTFVKIGLINDKGEIIEKGTVKTNFKSGYAIVIAEISKKVIELLDSLGLKCSDLGGVGIGVPGTVHNDIVVFANNLVWYNVPIVDEFRRHLQVDNIKVANDANAAILGEYSFGNAIGYENVVMITLGTGLGTGIIIDGKILLGNKSAGGEGGHMVIKLDGHDCNCGRRGCWEEYASTSAMILMTSNSIKANPNSVLAKIAETAGEVNGYTLFNGVREGDEIAIKLLNKFIKNVAEGLTNLVNLLRPEIILVGGGISNEQSLLIEPLEEIVNKYAYGAELGPHVKIEKAILGNDAGIVGATCLVMKK